MVILVIVVVILVIAVVVAHLRGRMALFEKPVEVPHEVAHQVGHGRTPHEHGQTDEKPWEVCRHNVEETKDTHPRIGMFAAPNPNAHEDERNRQKRHFHP